MGILRFLLAFSVLIGHSDHSLGIRALHTTVAVRSFYVISGFYMALVLSSKYHNKPYYVFLRSRYLRLFPAYFVILMLTCLYGLVTYYTRGTVEWPFQSWSRTITNLDTGTIFVLSFCNSFFLGQDILSNFYSDQSGNLQFLFSTPQLRSIIDGYMFIPQAWTLGLELLFYIIAPFFVVRSAVFISSIMLFSISLRYLVLPALDMPTTGLGYSFFPFELVYFALGALSYKVYEALKSYSISQRNSLFIATSLFILYAVPHSDFPEWPRYVALGACIPFLFSLSKNNRVDRLIGELSYPMYISHILVFFMLTQFTTLGTEGYGTAITIILSFLVYYYVERNLEGWRETLPSISIRRFPSVKALTIFALAVAISFAIPLAIRHFMQTRHLERSLPLAPFSLLEMPPANLVTVGMEPVESSEFSKWRWGLGPKTEMIFSLPHPVNMIVTMEYAPLPQGQTTTIIYNDIVLEKITSTEPGTVYRQYTLPGRKENNVIRIDYEDWNGKKRAYVPEDSRPLAVAFTKLEISFVAPK